MYAGIYNVLKLLSVDFWIPATHLSDLLPFMIHPLGLVLVVCPLSVPVVKLATNYQ